MPRRSQRRRPGRNLDFTNTVEAFLPKGDTKLCICSLIGNSLTQRNVILKSIHVECLPAETGTAVTLRPMMLQLRLGGPVWTGETDPVTLVGIASEPYRILSQVNPTSYRISPFTPTMKQPFASEFPANTLVVSIEDNITQSETDVYCRITTVVQLLPQTFINSVLLDHRRDKTDRGSSTPPTTVKPWDQECSASLIPAAGPSPI